jgi:ubiquitin-protein ligase E3 C
MAGLSETLGGLEELAASVNIELLSEALIRASKTNALLAVQPQARLWLLAHLIRLNRLRDGTNQEPIYMRALSVLISCSASEIVGRIDADDSESLHPSADDEDDTHIYAQPLPRFVKEELVTLVNKQSITGLLEKFNA